MGIVCALALAGPAVRAEDDREERHKHKDAASMPAHQQEPPPEDAKTLIPQALQIPGTDIYVSFGGYVKVDVIQDFDPIGNSTVFKTNTIPVDGTPEADGDGASALTARETRFNVDFRSNVGGTKMRAFFEGDFYGDGNSFRLRHGYGEAGRVLGGQTWTTFMDISARPLTVDYEGPDGELFVRQALVRYTQHLNDRWTWAIAVEEPDPEFVVPGTLSGSPQAEFPDVPTYVRYEVPQGHVQLAGIVRQIRFDGTAGSPDLDELGWGLSGTYRFKVYEQDELMGQLVYGEALGHYIFSMEGQNVDAFITPAGELETIPSASGVIGYIHHWNAKLRSGLAYAHVKLDDEPQLPGTTIAETIDARFNLLHRPNHLLEYGAELLWGRREDQDGTAGDAVRLQFAMIVHFN
jgi:hypothetical protein